MSSRVALVGHGVQEPGRNGYGTQYKLGKTKGLKRLSGVRLEVMAVGGLAAESLKPQHHLGGGQVGNCLERAGLTH